MIKIILNNSFCNLEGFTPELFTHVKQALTYKDDSVVKEKATIFMALQKAMSSRKIAYAIALKKRLKELGPEYICWLDEEGYFPTGLIHIVKESLQVISHPFTVVDNRKKPESYHSFRWNNKPHPLRYYQEEALRAGLALGRGVFEMSVGSGKSELAIYLIKELGMNTLFVVPSSALQTQIYDRFELAFGKQKVQKINTKDIKAKKTLKPIRVVTIQTLASLQKQGLLGNLLPDVDALFIDECHHAGSASFTNLLGYLSNIYYRFGLSGTYLRNDSKTMDLWGVSGEKLYEYSAAKATQEGFLTPVEFNIIPLKGKPVMNYGMEYKINYSSTEFLRSIENTLIRIPNDKQVLILVDRKEKCGDILFEFLKTKGYKKLNYVNGDDSKDDIRDAIENFNDKKDRILIASTILGEGCDIRSTDHLILARGGKSEIALTQAIGRAVRLYPGKEVAHVWDHNFAYSNYLRKHLHQRIQVFQKQFAGKINILKVA